MNLLTWLWLMPQQGFYVWYDGELVRINIVSLKKPLTKHGCWEVQRPQTHQSLPHWLIGIIAAMTVHPSGAETEYSRRSRSWPWLLMPWILALQAIISHDMKCARYAVFVSREEGFKLVIPVIEMIQNVNTWLHFPKKLQPVKVYVEAPAGFIIWIMQISWKQ